MNREDSRFEISSRLDTDFHGSSLIYIRINPRKSASHRVVSGGRGVSALLHTARVEENGGCSREHEQADQNHPDLP